MKIYKDIISGDEVLSDSYEINTVDDVLYEVKTKMILKNTDDKIDIGANPSTEKAEDEEEEEGAGGAPGPGTKEMVNNVIDAHQLYGPVPMSKSEFVTWVKGYSKAVLEKLKANESPRLDAFKKGMSTVVPKLAGKWSDFTVYEGASMNFDAGLILMFYKEEDQTNPCLYYFRDGLEEEKV